MYDLLACVICVLLNRTRSYVKCNTATKLSAIVGGQTSCKAPEIAAFEEYLPPDVDIVPCHSLHGPNVDTRGQPLVSEACPYQCSHEPRS